MNADVQHGNSIQKLSAHVMSIDSDTVLDDVLGVDCSAC